MAIRDSLKSLAKGAGSYNPALSPLQNALNLIGRKAAEKAAPTAKKVAKELVVKPVAKAAVTGAAVPVAGYKLLTGDTVGANRVIDQGFNVPRLGQVKPVGARTQEETARGQVLPSAGRQAAETLATGAAIAQLHPAAWGYGGAAKAVTGGISTGQKVLGALPTLAERVIPKSTTIKTALGRLGVQGAADFVPGAIQSAASDVLQGETNVKEIAKRAGLSGLFSAAVPIAIGGTSGLIKGAARQVGQARTKAQKFKNIARTVAEETGALTKSAQSIQDTGNLGRQFRKALEEKETALAARVAQADGAIPAARTTAGARVEGQYYPTATRGEASKLDKAKLKIVQQTRDFTKNWIDDRAPLTINLSSKVKTAGATDEEVEQLTAAVNDVRTSDAKSFARLNRVRENTDAIRPQNMGEADFDALVNKYSIAKSEAETIRDTDVLQRAAQAEVDALESTLDPETLAAVRQAHEINVRQFNDEILQSQVDSGMISAETAAKYRAEKPNYTKFIVEEKLPTDTDVLRGVGGARRGDVKGVKDAARVKELTEEMAKLPAKEANAVGAIIAERQNAKNIQATRAVDLDQKYGTGVFTKLDAPAEDAITLRRNGVEEYYKVNDRQVADYFRGKDQELGQIAQVAAWAANWTRQFATGANPAFAATNAIRDYATARDMLATRGITLTAGDWMDGLRAGRSVIFKKQGSKLDPLAQEAYELGGLLNSMSTRARSTDDITQAVSNLSKRESTVLSRLEDWNNQTELATRIAVLKAAKRAGIKDKAQLRSLIRDSTVDFQVGGQMMREWNKAIPFMNARLQGLRNVVKRIADDPATAARVGQLYTNFAQTLIDAQNARYGDVLNRIAPTERQDNFVLVLGTYEDNGQKQPLYVRVPKGSIGQMAGMVKDAVDPIPGDTRSARERTEDLLIGFTRFSPIQGIPSIGSSFVDTYKGLTTNKDWRNYNIVPEYLNKPGVSPLMQKTKTTSESVTAAVEALNRVTGGSDTTEGKIALSPAKTEFALRTLFSGVGNQAVGVADMLYNLATKGSPVPSNLPDGSALGVASKLPILSSFIRSRALSTDPQVEQKNIEAARQVSLIQGREKESAEQMLERIKAASPEERVKIIEENPALAEEAAKRLQERSFIEGVNPNDSLANQGIQLYNALASKQTPEEQADLLKRVQEYRASSPNGVIYSQAYALVEKIKQSSQEERVALVQRAQENGLFDNEKFTEALGIYLQMK